MSDIVREKLGMGKPKHKFSQYDPYTDDADGMEETINYEAQDDQHS